MPRPIFQSSRPSVVGGRYRVEREIARGGMGTVYAVVDESTGERVALKRLGAEPNVSGATRRKCSPTTSALFQLEYATLSRLRHPSIIDVYEYGVDCGVPYYTMELLDGHDLREMAPLQFQDACRNARDVASSLALLHAHRLVHRDVTPRNVRVTAGGRAKLFDFGTLTPFGVPTDIAGTPSCVPPEALDGAALDHRADLYSLGSVLYWLLTAREAFPARRLDELASSLEVTPPPPSFWVESIPEELDALVLSMLSKDPLARPSSAAEVIERLEAISALEPEARLEVAHAYVQSAKTVGRDVEIALLNQRIERALSGKGSSVFVEGERGVGKSRLVREMALQAQLRGTVVLVVDAGLYAGPNAIARELATRLLQHAPLEATATAEPYATYLCHVVPELATRLAFIETARSTDAPGEWRMRIYAALRSWFADFTQRRPVVVIVDDLDRADESAAAFVASLARGAAGRRLLVVATSSGDGAGATDGREPAFGTRLRLGRLGRPAVSELTHSLFGDTRHTRRFARRLHDFSAGVPSRIMDLVTHVVKSRVVRYEGGVWMLPEEASTGSLPSSVEEVVAARLGHLGAESLAFAEALSVASAALPLGVVLGLADEDTGLQSRRARSLLDQLLAEGVLVGAGGRFRIAQESLREALLSRLDDDRRRRIHRQIGEGLLRARDGTTFDAVIAGWHLLRSGDEERGAEILASAGRQLMLESDDLHAAVPALEAALVVYRRLGRAPHELAALVGPLAAAAYFVDRRLAARYGAEALSLFSQATGLDRLAGAPEGARPTLAMAVASAAVERRLGPSGGAPVATRELFELFFRCSMTLSGVAAVCVDSDSIRAVERALAPLEGLGSVHAGPLVHRYCSHLLALSEGRWGEAHEGLSSVLVELQRGDRLRSFPEHARQLFVGGALYALGALESLRDGSEALSYADRLDGLDLRLYDMVADQLRMLHHAHRGEVELSRSFRDRVENTAIEGGSAWQVEVWEQPLMLLVYVRESNVMGLKTTAERLERLAREIPSLDRFAQIARAAHLRLRGEFGRAAALLEGVVREGLREPFSGHPLAVALLADVCNARGEYERAEQVTSELLSAMPAGDRSFTRVTVLPRIQYANALAGLGEIQAAYRALDETLADCEAGRGPVTLGLLHQARARIALGENDLRSFETHQAAMERWLRPTSNPALVAMCERLRYDARRDKGSGERRILLEPDDFVSTSRKSVG